MQPTRTLWNDFPDVIIHVPESSVKKHTDYEEAKKGDPDAAFRLVRSTISSDAVEQIERLMAGRKIFLASIHAVEKYGVNAIPEALANELAARLGCLVDGSIVQVNVVGHTGADGYSRLARQALFDGDVVSETNYFLVDDFVGQGGTLANFKGYIESKGGNVMGATVLTGKPYSARLTPTKDQLLQLRAKHENLEEWWKIRFGYGFDCLTQSEARYLERSPDADTIRNRVTASE